VRQKPPQAAITATTEETTNALEIVIEGDLVQMMADFEQDPNRPAAEYSGKRFIFRAW
jgi:hypothetical protein